MALENRSAADAPVTSYCQVRWRASTAGFVGRARECQALDRMLERRSSWTGAAVVIRGEAGIGKTALLEHCARQAGTVDSCESPASSLSSRCRSPQLHQLCNAVVDQLAAVPDPQQQALNVAFGLTAGNAPDRFFVGLAVLSLLAEAAAERPWCASSTTPSGWTRRRLRSWPSSRRRLLADAVVLVLAVRDEGVERRFLGLPSLTIEGLALDDGRALFEDRRPLVNRRARP